MRLGPAVTLAALILTAGGCTAVNAQVHIVRAEGAIKRAEESGAAQGAVYEYTLASRYLDKAREESVHNRFGAAEELARSATGFADQAVIALAAAGRRQELDAAGGMDALPDTIGAELQDTVEVMEDYVDLPEGQQVSPDDLITDQEVEQLFGRQALEAMQEEGGALQRPGQEDAPRRQPGDETAPTPAPGTDAAPVDPAAPTEAPPAEDGWQDLSPGDDQ